ncbi:hypothetical protein PVAG01_05114 [Phlyctema vagabunda]|uniref:Defective in cullin neddylation protein n=1 Tax=Phlyctema vagabunda TaxID=108571 RepID=A0ABR4PJW0_9HELO
MPPTMKQRSDISQFMALTGANERTATKFMKGTAWKLDAACDSYFATNGTTSSAAKDISGALNKLFDSYRDEVQDETDTTGVDSTMRYLGDLEVNLENIEVLVPLEIVQAPVVGEMSRQGFVDGWKALGLDTIAKQKTYVAQQVSRLTQDLALFKRVYRHTFVCARENGAKALKVDDALVYWGMLFSSSGRPWATNNTDWFGLWTEFLQTKWTKSVNKDMWNQTLEFANKSMQDETLSFWTEDGAWPSVVDEFVAYIKVKKGALPEAMETD